MERDEEDDSPSALHLRPGAIYLVKERKPSLSYRLFEKAVGSGLPGLCVTRQHPSRLKEKIELQNTRFLWLSQAPGKGHHNPTDIGALATLISSFIEKYKTSVCLIDGLEYLVINNGFQQVLKFTELINEQAMQSDSMIFIPISLNAFSDKEYALLERNVESMEGTAAQAKNVEKEIADLIDKYR